MPSFAESDEFVGFASATTEWRASPAFPDASQLPGVKRTGKLAAGRPARTLVLDHLAYALVRVRQ